MGDVVVQRAEGEAVAGRDQAQALRGWLIPIRKPTNVSLGPDQLSLDRAGCRATRRCAAAMAMAMATATVLIQVGRVG